MPAPILFTKLFIPPPPPKVVLRLRLVERLNAGLDRKLTLISAAAGFGKTTLVSAWIAGGQRPAAWLSLDEGDNDPARFLTYLVAALQTLALSNVEGPALSNVEGIAPPIGKGALAALQSPQPPAAEALLTTLLNEIAGLSENFTLVLDDYHVIDSQPVDQALVFLVEHQPPQMHLVIATREDPPLPLARLRVRGQLTELRAADLRFTPAEAAEFLNRMMGLNLGEADIAALEARTEGWIAGLQLAALSMQGRSDTAGFIQAFTGSHRFVLDYLVEEVLRHQPEAVRSFLLQTALLDRFCAPLCNAVTEREDGKAMLDALERSNLFLIPLDDRRQWYRYHHLFAEVLQAHLMEAQPEQVAVLHQRASAWYAQQGFTPDAILHALAAKDFEHAAALLERVWLEMDLNYQSAAWLGWVKALPDELVRLRPVLSVGIAWALLNGGELEASEARLQEAERWLAPAGSPAGPASAQMVVVDEVEFRSLPASIASARAYRALALGDIPAAQQYARQTLALAPAADAIRRTQATALLGLAEYASGNLPAAEQELTKFQELMWQANDLASAIGITFTLANIHLAQGRLQAAVGAYRQALQAAESRAAPLVLGTADLHRGLSELLCEQGDLETAWRHLRTAQQLGKQLTLTGWPHRLCVTQARLQASTGDLAGALALLEEAERQYVRNPLPDRPIAALKAQVWARQGDWSAALAWARAQHLSPDDELSYPREFEHLTLARVLIARGAAQQVAGSLPAELPAALGLLKRLQQAAEAGGRYGTVIEILILQARARQAQGSPAAALAALERALALAEPEGYVRSFVEEGEALRTLLEALARRRDHPQSGYAGRLLAAFTLPPAAPKPGPGALAGLIEPLSARELDVLKLLRSELSGPEIAQQLSVSLNTLRTHTKNIFRKLGVSHRRAAVRRAEELDLF